MISISEAIAHITPAFTPREAERIPLDDALGRILAAPIDVAEHSPPFDCSAMDGYAVRASDVEGASESNGIDLPLHGESRAGGGLPVALPPGHAMRIFTGAPMPDGADAVVMQEDTRREEETAVTILFASTRHHHVRLRGNDLSAGTLLCEAGTPVTAGVIAALASQNISKVDVYRQPVVAILSTGDELRPLGSASAPGTIVNSNAHMLAALVREAGAIPRVHPIVPDKLEAVVEALRQALEADVVMSTGGVSVGDYDVVKAAFERVGVQMTFWKIRVKPGKPVAFGVFEQTPVVGLPGNPVSAFVTFHLFARAGLRQMLGDRRPYPPLRRVKLAHEHRRKAGRTELARGRLTGDSVTLHVRQASGAISSICWANALVILPAERDSFSAGEFVEALPLLTMGEADPPFRPADTSETTA